MADVTRLLEEAGVDFDVLEHAHTERAVDEAAALGIGPEEVAKTLVLVAPGENGRAVLAAGTGSPPFSESAARGCTWRARTSSRAPTLSSSSLQSRRSAAARIG